MNTDLSNPTFHSFSVFLPLSRRTLRIFKTMTSFVKYYNIVTHCNFPMKHLKSIFITLKCVFWNNKTYHNIANKIANCIIPWSESKSTYATSALILYDTIWYKYKPSNFRFLRYNDSIDSSSPHLAKINFKVLVRST